MPELGQTKSTVFDPGSTTVNPVEYARQQIRLKEAQNAMLLQEMRERAALAREGMAMQERMGSRQMDIQESDPDRRAKAQLAVQGGTGMDMQTLSMAPQLRALDLSERRYSDERSDNASQRLVGQLQQMAVLRDLRQTQLEEYGSVDPLLDMAAQRAMAAIASVIGPGQGGGQAAEAPQGGSKRPKLYVGHMPPSGGEVPPASPAAAPAAVPAAAVQQAPVRRDGSRSLDDTRRALTGQSGNLMGRIPDIISKQLGDGGGGARASRQAGEELEGITNAIENIAQAGEATRKLQEQEAKERGLNEAELLITANPTMGPIFEEVKQRGFTTEAAILKALEMTKEGIPAREEKDLSDVAYFADLDDGGTPTAQHFTAIRQRVQSTYEQILATSSKADADAYIDRLIAKMAEEFGDSEEDIQSDMNAQESRQLLRFLQSLRQQSEVKYSPKKGKKG